MNELALDPKLMPIARAGTKKITIRNGWRPDGPGPFKLRDADNEDHFLTVDVFSVTWTYAQDVPLRLCRDDGFDNQNELIKGMSEYYKDFQPWSKVTIYQWR